MKILKIETQQNDNTFKRYITLETKLADGAFELTESAKQELLKIVDRAIKATPACRK